MCPGGRWSGSAGWWSAVVQAGGRVTCATSLVSAVAGWWSAVSGQCMGANVRLVPGLA
ncbi:MAG: hypothetical protein HQL05_07480 [Nitrospirae bacterium]|uniref:hypothetical protein n=1 Tax=Candidatus Magnetobacterium casense TaxID=1455061 RepID=UPI0012DF9990|nr:hypothetical protein [Candidatus Magnetobacterium casensis]MBF0337661.1 hypothetical protein [Nitrospirota bacterium]